MNRRFFLHKGALAVAGTAAMPNFLVRSVLAQTGRTPGQRLVVIFQRGAADGLNVVVPYQEKNYYTMRPTIAIPQNQVVDLDGFFGLHPSLAAFKPLYDQKQLAIVHACGSPDMSRSHAGRQDSRNCHEQRKHVHRGRARTATWPSGKCIRGHVRGLRRPYLPRRRR